MVIKQHLFQSCFLIMPACFPSISERGTCCDAHKPQNPMRYKQTQKWLQSNRNGFGSNVSILANRPCLNDYRNGREGNHENLVPKKITTVSPSPESENILRLRSHGLDDRPSKQGWCVLTRPLDQYWEKKRIRDRNCNYGITPSVWAPSIRPFDVSQNLNYKSALPKMHADDTKRAKNRETYKTPQY